MSSGPHVERLLAVAANSRVVVVGGWRDAPAPAPARVHILAVASGKSTSVAVDGTVHSLWCNDELVFAATSTGRLVAWEADLSAAAPVMERTFAAPVRVVTGLKDRVVCGTEDGCVHDLRAVAGLPGSTIKLGERPITALAVDPGGVVLAGADDGNIWAVGESGPFTAGGEAGVRALLGLGDGRFVAGFGDGSVRIGYVQGAVEALDRTGDKPHDGAVRGLALAPVTLDAAGRELPRRFFSASEDGSIKVWLVEGRRPPRTLTPGAGTLTDLVVAAGAVRGQKDVTGRLIAVSAARKIVTMLLGKDGDVLEGAVVDDSEIDRLASVLADRRPRAAAGRKAAVAALAALGEDDARVLLERALGADADPGVRAEAAAGLSRWPRARVALRSALSDNDKSVRAAAFASLRTIEAADPAAALRAALRSTAEDTRLAALDALADAVRTAPLSIALAVGALSDTAVAVRARALDVLEALAANPDIRVVLGASATDPLAAHRVALARGPADVRARALRRIGVLARDPAAVALVAESFDDPDASVGDAAFDAALLQHPRLLGRLRATWPKLAEGVRDLGPADGTLDEADLGPLFAAVACRSAAQAVRGAQALVGVGDSRALGVVLRLTRAPDAGVRRAVVAVLGAARAAFPDEEERLSSRLAWFLDDTDGQVRADAFTLLEKSAKEPAAQVGLAGVALRSSAADIRTRALQIVVRHGKGSEFATAQALLADALDDESADVRNEAFRTLWSWNPNKPEIPLERGARCRHADVRGRVVAEISRRRQAGQSNARLDALLLPLVSDASADVGKAAYTELLRVDADAKRLDIHLAAMKSPAAPVRAAGARGCHKAAAAAAKTLPNPLVALLYGLIQSDNSEVHLAAIEALDTIAPKDQTGFALAFDAIFYELRVRAGELLGQRRDPRAGPPLQKLLAIPATDLNRPSDPLRQRAARALADVGDPALIPGFIAHLDDRDALVREMAARGLATACGPGREAPLVDALVHPDLAVRSWAAEGLAKLGDVRSSPVLVGTVVHGHLPLRLGAIVGFAALGPDGVRGLRQGLEDPEREVQELVFAVIVARDAALAEAGLAPDLLTDALSATNAEIAWLAARLLEARASGEAFDVSGLFGPPRPERASDMAQWPSESRRAELLAALVASIASDDPVRRYAAARVSTHRSQPLTFWREAARLATPAELIPHTNWATEARSPRKSGWLRRIGASKQAAAPAPAVSELARVVTLLRATGADKRVPARGESAATAEARRLAFGTYAGLIRQAPAPGQGDETHRVRRDAITRLVQLAGDSAVGEGAVRTLLAQALRDPHHLVRQAAMSGLVALHPPGALAPLAMALTAAADVGRRAIDALTTLALGGDTAARALVLGALDAEDPEVRAHAALRVMRLFPAGSVEPILLAARSRHSDVRLEAVERLIDASSGGGVEVAEALAGALTSDRSDLRLRAAAGLARRGDTRGIEVLGGFLADEVHAEDALEALISFAARPAGAAPAAAAIARRIEEDTDRSADRAALFDALGQLGADTGVDVLLTTLAAPDPEGKAEEQAALRRGARLALAEIVRDRGARPRRLPDGRSLPIYRAELARRVYADVVRCADADVRATAAAVLGEVDDRGVTTGVPVDDLLTRLLADRALEVRVAAAQALALRAEVFGASLAPLAAALRAGRRELVLPAAEGLAQKRRPEAFQALLLVLKAGEPEERQRALLALGTLGDPRCLDDVVPLLDPTEDGDQTMIPPAFEAVGRLLATLPEQVEGHDVPALRERLERAALQRGDVGQGATRGLRHAGDDRSRALLERIATSDDGGSPVYAIQQLGQLANPASEAPLVSVLSHNEPRRRREALAALYRIFPDDRTRVDFHALGSTADDIRDPAAHALALAGDANTLVRRLGTLTSADTRRRIREGLERRGEFPLPAVEEALGAELPAARAEAARLAGAAAAPPVAGALARSALRAADAWRAARAADGAGAGRAADEALAWESALWAARRLPGTEVLGAASAAMAAHVPARVRRQAVAWLTDAGRGAVSAGAVGDADPVVRAFAAAAASKLPAAQVSAIVADLATRADPTLDAPLVRAALPAMGARLLQDAGTRPLALAVSVTANEIEALVAAATASGADPARLAAIAALGRVGGDAAKAALEALLADKSNPAAVRAAAWKAFARLRRRATVRFAEGVDRERRGALAGVDGAGDADDGDDEDFDGDDEDEDFDEDDEDSDEDEDDDDDGYDDDEEDEDDE